ncbi:hypothetical protein H6G76_30125 [Nostoc sp. FACHB-152]|uniref:hypothetical protein n=1 Tax=unclassified Nostoc TaxID=2593658 RepID=UPI00168751E8|nr:MULTISPECIES: hypothetical protein [unclassified Nostoc]MBD2451310.1 hypothetical protein [Nostoc sp. FACHB-152]MBD2471264.1 hypothetical protein [Nostoc sp. FACHB-145]
MTTSSTSPENTLVSDNSTINDNEVQIDSLSPVLPRSAWNSQIAYLRVLFRAKKALDRIEKEAGILRN